MCAAWKGNFPVVQVLLNDGAACVDNRDLVGIPKICAIAFSAVYTVVSLCVIIIGVCAEGENASYVCFFEGELDSCYVAGDDWYSCRSGGSRRGVFCPPSGVKGLKTIGSECCNLEWNIN